MNLGRSEGLETSANAVRLRLASFLRLDARPSLGTAAGELALLRHRERLLARVATVAERAHREWEAGEDLDEAMRLLRAELRTAAEFTS